MTRKQDKQPEVLSAKQERQQPAHEIRIGRVRATLWENQHPEKGKWYSIILARSYKDAQGQWKSASSFGRDDLLVVAEVCRQAFHWIHGQSQQSDTSENGPEDE